MPLHSRTWQLGASESGSLTTSWFHTCNLSRGPRLVSSGSHVVSPQPNASTFFTRSLMRVTWSLERSNCSDTRADSTSSHEAMVRRHSRTTSWAPCSMATISAVEPRASRCIGSPWLRSSTATLAQWFPPAAMCRGPLPLPSRASTSAPSASISSMVCAWFRPASMCKAVRPCLSLAFRSTSFDVMCVLISRMSAAEPANLRNSASLPSTNSRCRGMVVALLALIRSSARTFSNLPWATASRMGVMPLASRASKSAWAWYKACTASYVQNSSMP
mmetsp:Transcript_9819/g.29132  ORF Transcript_9819/g.29132 Transcript_9819/m.29132 type:complete len:274 (+) Transcript_9819:105-926(+)